MSEHKGVFVVFEGGDAVGKTTQVNALCDWLTEQNQPFIRTFEPGDTWLGKDIRRMLLEHGEGEVSCRTEALLYAADKAQHVSEVVLPALRRGEVVVCDRYVDSMLAYQGAGRVLDVSEVESIARWATENLRPDLTVLLDADPKRILKLIKDKDRLESAGLEFHQRVREHFLDLAEQDPDHYLILPGRTDRERIAGEVRDRVAQLLQEHQLT